MQILQTEWGTGRISFNKCFLKTERDVFRVSGCILFHVTIAQGKKECLKVPVLHWYVGIFPETLVW